MKARAIVSSAVALGAIFAALDPLAQAQPGDPCFVAPVDGQKLRKAGKLLDARTQFATCARQTCPTEIVQRCSQWSEEVQAAIPSVVLAARDTQGRDLADVTVSVDGAAAAPMGTRGIDLDPGEHRFVFQHAGSPDVEQRYILREGEKNREVVATFGASASPAVPTVASSPSSAESPSDESRPVPTLTWVLGGIGVAALASFGTFGALGVSERSTDGCDKACPPSQKSDVDTKFLIADVSLGVGVVALGVATWLYVSRPSVPTSASAYVDLRSTPGGGLAVFGGRF